MKEGLRNENSFIIDRNWEKVNPINELTVSIDQTKEFLKLLVYDHQKLKKINEINLEDINPQKLEEKIEVFIFKFIQEREISLAAKRELPTLQKSPYRLDLTDCLEIWRWLSEDSVSFKTKQVSYDESMIVNQFELSKSYETFEIKKNVDYGSSNKRIFSELSLEQQELVLKKSLEMVHLYYYQFKIIFNHYCKFVIENEHKRTFTFDDMTHSLERLTVNRFMLFCREFDIIKTLEFKRKTERNPTMSKQFLLKIFKKGSHLQKFMTYDSFLMALVHISIKIHQNFDPRSYMHIELFLNSLKVKYYEEFVKKLDSLDIKYSPTQFYNCYKHIFNKLTIKKKKESKSSLFGNPYFTKQQNSSRVQKMEEPGVTQSLGIKPRQSKVQSRIRSYQSVPSLAAEQYRNSINSIKKTSKTLQKRKVSVPILPSLEQNKYFKPIQPNYSRSVYNKYLEKVQYSTSVFKNRITGYSNINHLKTKGFHMNDNPESISKETFENLMVNKKLHMNSINKEDKIAEEASLNGSSIMQGSLLSENISKLAPVPQIYSNTDKLSKSDQHLSNPKTHTMNAHQFLEREENKKVLQGLKQKIDVKDNDQILNKHLIAEQKEREANTQLSSEMAK